MNRRKILPNVAAGIFVSLLFLLAEEITVQASEKEGHNFLSSGVAEILDPSALSNDAPVQNQTSLDINEKFEAEKERMEQELTMANVQNALNIRERPVKIPTRSVFCTKTAEGRSWSRRTAGQS